MVERVAGARRWIVGTALVTSLAASLAATGAVAQTDDPASLSGSDFEPVTYEEVLKNPDDVDLNLRYARTRIEDGRLDIAATTLERILILNPDLTQVRMLYAIVLYRLDNLPEAKREFETVQEDEGVPAKIARQTEQYLDAIAQRQKSLTGALTLGAGLHYDTNKNSYPEGDQFRILDTVIDGQQNQNEDFGQIGFANLKLDYDPGAQRVRSLYLDTTLLGDNQNQEDDLDLLAGLVEVGGTIDLSVVEATPHLRYEHLYVGGRRYVQVAETGLRVSRQYESIQGLRSFAAIRAGYESYNNTPDLRFNNEQNGMRYEADLGAAYRWTENLRLRGGYRFTVKDAEEGYHRYLGHRLRANATYVFGNQSFLNATASIERQIYEDADPFISATRTRRDTDSRVRLTYGVPVAAVIESVTGEAGGDWTRSLVTSFTGEYLNSDSNIRNFDYDNWRATGLVTKRFTF